MIDAILTDLAVLLVMLGVVIGNRGALVMLVEDIVDGWLA